MTTHTRRLAGYVHCPFLPLAFGLAAFAVPLRDIGGQLAGHTPREKGGTSTPGAAEPKPVDPTFVDAIVARFQPNAAQRARIVPTLTQLINLGKVDPSTLSDLIGRTGTIPELADEAASVLIGAAQGNGDPITKRLLGETVLTNAAASVGADRALATSTLVDYGTGRWALRLVTASAVSNADSTAASGAPGTASSPSTTSNQYRTRTGDLLTMMQAGGNGVLRLNYDASRNPKEARGFHASVMADVGVMGNWLNANTQSRFTGGSTLEASWHSTSIDPVGLFISIRGGGRWAKDGIVSSDPRHQWLAFGQFLFEFHFPGGKIPLGISGNLVNKDVRTYALPLHIYTDFGK